MDTLVYLTLTLLIWGTWRISQLGLFEPGDDTGYWIGVSGAAMMLLLLSYPLRKYVRFAQRWGSIKGWFWLHIALGVLGPLLILLHSNFRTASLNAAVALYSMLVVAGSGVVGRFIFQRINRGLQGEQTDLKTLMRNAGMDKEDARSRLAFAPRVEQCGPSMSALDCAHRSALATAAQAKQAMVSFSRALSAKWQGSMDLHYSEVGALPAVGNFQAQPATGAQYNVSFQLTGSNLYSSRDISGFNISQVTSDTMSGTQLGYNNLTGFMGDKMSLEPSIRYYTQTDNTQTKISRISPGLRVSYKLSERANLMAEGIYETSQTDGPTNHETSESYFFYLGYRYDFQ